MTTEKELFIFIKSEKDKKINNSYRILSRRQDSYNYFINNYGLSEIEKLTAIKYWSRMNELTNMFQLKIFQKTRKLSKNDKFAINYTKICLFCYRFIFFGHFQKT